MFLTEDSHKLLFINYEPLVMARNDYGINSKSDFSSVDSEGEDDEPFSKNESEKLGIRNNNKINSKIKLILCKHKLHYLYNNFHAFQIRKRQSPTKSNFLR